MLQIAYNEFQVFRRLTSFSSLKSNELCAFYEKLKLVLMHFLKCRRHGARRSEKKRFMKAFQNSHCNTRN